MRDEVEIEVLKDSISVSIEGLLIPRYELEYLLHVRVNERDYLVKEKKRTFTFWGMRRYIRKELSIYGDEVYERALRVFNEEWKKWINL